MAEAVGRTAEDAERTPAAERYERSSISVRAVLIGGSAIAAGVLVSLLAARGLLDASGGPPPPITGQPFTHVAGPPLETTPEQDLARFRAEERDKLSGHHLIDQQAGVVQIPIERAMELIAAEHENEQKR